MTPVDRYSLLVFYHTFDDMKAEHAELKHRLRQLHRAAKTSDEHEIAVFLVQMEDAFIRFMEDVKSYAAKEERDILPVAGPHTELGESAVPILENNLQMACHYYVTFLDMKRNTDAALLPLFTNERYLCLMRALAHVIKYFRIEEEFVFPVSERVMTDLAYNAL
ncbi:hypothetical protein MO973_18475 [Paenibacillus sp. TRM 82003]|nr:hypothetical protein [Paenibacillus sp. TRM 82003]